MLEVGTRSRLAGMMRKERMGTECRCIIIFLVSLSRFFYAQDEQRRFEEYNICFPGCKAVHRETFASPTPDVIPTGKYRNGRSWEEKRRKRGKRGYCRW